MPFDIAKAGSELAAAIIVSLKTDSARVKALALAEAGKIAHAVAAISGLLAAGQINREEAEVLVRIQRDASESVLASIAEVSRVSARRAVGLGLKSIADLVDAGIGFPLAGALLRT